MLPQKEEVSPFPTNIRDVSFNNFWLEAIILLFSIMKNFIEINILICNHFFFQKILKNNQIIFYHKLYVLCNKSNLEIYATEYFEIL